MCRELIHEEKAAQIRYRNTFGTQRVGGFIANAFDLYLKNPANTNVVEWGQRLRALWEVGLVYDTFTGVVSTCWCLLHECHWVQLIGSVLGFADQVVPNHWVSPGICQP